MPLDLAQLFGAGQQDEQPPAPPSLDPSKLSEVLAPTGGNAIRNASYSPAEVAQQSANKIAPDRPIQAMLTNTLSMMAQNFQPIAPPAKQGFMSRWRDNIATSNGGMTDFEKQLKAQNANMDMVKTMGGLENQEFTQSRAQQMITVNGMTMPLDIAKVYFPNYFKGVQEQGKNDRNTANNQTKENIAGQRDQTKRLLGGYNPDGTLNPAGVQKFSLGQSKLLLQDAQTELAQAKASAEPQRLRIAEANLGIAQGNLNLRSQEFSQKVSGLSPAGQKVMMDVQPAKEQVEELLQKLDPLKGDNTPGYFAADRLKYAVGMDSDGGDMERSISQLELNRILAGARLLKGGSRAYQALKLAMVHAPQTWKDSPQLMHNKLTTILGTLNQMEDAAQQYGGYQGNARPGVTQPSASDAPKVGDKKTFPNKRTATWDGHGWAAD